MTSDDTTASRREALFAKREQLRAAQAERMAQQRHGENVARFQRYLGGRLEQAGVRHALLWDDAPRSGPLARYPIGFASVRWDRVPHAVSTYGGTDELQKSLFDAALAALSIAPESTVIVDWSMDGMPRVALSAADASVHALALMRQASDVWIYAADADWLIEIHHEGSVTYADRPGRPEDAGDGWRKR